MLSILPVLCAAAFADGARLSEAQREQIIRAFLAEHPFAQCAVPVSKAGIIIEGSKISPPPAELDRLAARNGAAARAGERVQITDVRFVRQGILFELNGGFEKRKRWTDRITVGMSAPSVPDDPSAAAPGVAPGSSVLLKLAGSTAISPEQIKALLAPVLDFGSASQAAADRKTLPPVVAAAIQEHRALVGMDRDMVLAALGRPPSRLRETNNGVQYEEWIYGSPPREVQFIRFVRGKVVRIEEMRVTGEKLVRTQDEVGQLDASSHEPAAGNPAATAAPAMAAPAERASEAPRSKPPTLLRPGESLPGREEPAPAALPASAPQPARN